MGPPPLRSPPSETRSHPPSSLMPTPLRTWVLEPATLLETSILSDSPKEKTSRPSSNTARPSSNTDVLPCSVPSVCSSLRNPSSSTLSSRLTTRTSALPFATSTRYEPSRLLSSKSWPLLSEPSSSTVPSPDGTPPVMSSEVDVSSRTITSPVTSVSILSDLPPKTRPNSTSSTQKNSKTDVLPCSVLRAWSHRN